MFDDEAGAVDRGDRDRAFGSERRLGREPARPSSAATSRSATGSTSRPTPGRPGSTWASRRRGASAGSSSIRAIRTSSSSRRSAPATARSRSAASIGRPTAARHWERVLFVDENTGVLRPGDGSEQPARCSSPARGRSTSRRGEGRAAGPGAASSSRATAARPGSGSRGTGCREPPLGKIAVAVAPSDSQRVYALIETGAARARSGAPTTAARSGNSSTAAGS